MPDSNVIVSTIIQLDLHQIEPRVAALDLAAPDLAPRDREARPLTVHFAEGGIATLDPSDSEFAINKQILTEFHGQGLQVYAEVSSDNGNVRNLLIPVPGKVVDLARRPSGDVMVVLDRSAKPFVLKRDLPRHADFLSLLQNAHLDRATVLVTEDEAESAIVDVRLMENPPEPAHLEVAAFAPALRPAVPAGVTSQRAEEMFQLVSGRTCAPPGPLAAPCIPFLYPDNGCHARAHEMFRLMSDAGEQPRKIWNCSRDVAHDPLVVNTPNSPDCQVQWSFHVSVTLEVETPGNAVSDTMVIDPSLFPDGPVTVATWQGVQGSTNTRLMLTSGEPYLPPGTGNVVTDPTFKTTREDLTIYRGLLSKRLHRSGAPPYNCG